MNDREYRLLIKIFVLAVFLSIAWMTYGFLDTLALSCAFAYMGKPIYDKIKPYTGNSIAALICLLIFIIPTVIVGYIILKEFLVFVQQSNISMNIQDIDVVNKLNEVLYRLSSIFGYPMHINEKILYSYLSQIWLYIEPYIKHSLSQIMVLPELTIKTMIVLFMTYYFLKDGYKVKKALLSQVPDRYYKKTEIFLNDLNESYKNLFIGNALTSIAIGIISGIGYYLIGIPNAFILAVITCVFALLPVIGGWTVYIPISIYYIIMGEVLKGIELLLFGAIFLSTLPDFVIRPLIVKKESDVHPSLILIAFLIGPLAFGLGGFAIGPLIVGAFDAIWKVKLKNYDKN
ncbi:AI-2E family transporter [Methanothermococcus sp.]|uniref:AI-2E family transporter n=1 Tax=Methanothermococcus sp. TaxID=2614238 RepID=UPI0025FD8C8F|nr:AI-2E family transporter [Methanothermococcus sp.]